ncbi:hypothetical protein ACHAW6_007051 [Cyclotella cf. meneghiniana]
MEIGDLDSAVATDAPSADQTYSDPKICCDDASASSLFSRHQIILQQLNHVTKFSDEWFRWKDEEVKLRCYLAAEESTVVEEGMLPTSNNDDGNDETSREKSKEIEHDHTRSLDGPEPIENEDYAPNPTTFTEGLRVTGHLSVLQISKKSLSEKRKQAEKSIDRHGNRPIPPRATPLFDDQILSDEPPLPSVYDRGAIGQKSNRNDSSGTPYDNHLTAHRPEITEDSYDAPVPIPFCWGEETMGPRHIYSKSSLSGKRHTQKNAPTTDIGMSEIYNSFDMQSRPSVQSINSDQHDDKQFNNGSLSESGMIAIAYPKRETSIDAPIFEASEYDPSSTTSFYKSARCRVYSAVSLLITAAILSVGVVYGLKKKIGDNGIDDKPTQFPNIDLATDREYLGLQDIIESEVLERQVKFQEMDNLDPRYLALQWILLQDTFQDNTNLFQRYILALLAFSFDSDSWDCGALYDVESCNKTEVVDDYSLWLSGSSECLWYGVSCDDGFVRGLNLSSNNLIGEIPPEIGGLRFLERLSLSKNCLYGTLPSELWKLASLIEIDFSGNALSG